MNKRLRTFCALLITSIFFLNGQTLFAQQQSKVYLPYTASNQFTATEFTVSSDEVQAASAKGEHNISLIVKVKSGAARPRWITDKMVVDTLQKGRLIRIQIPTSRNDSIVIPYDRSVESIISEGHRTELTLAKPLVLAQGTNTKSSDIDSLKRYFGSGSGHESPEYQDIYIDKNNLPNLERYWREWAYKKVGLGDAHRISTGEAIVIALLDTGVDLKHYDLREHVNSEIDYDIVGDDQMAEDMTNNKDDDGDGHIDEAWGHGTHVAGIIAEVAPQADIMPVRVLDSDGNGQLWNIIDGIYYAVDNGAHIINMSFGTPIDHPLLEEALLYADRKGVLLVAAAGNSGSHLQYPARYSFVTSVGATDHNDRVAEFSTKYKKKVDIFAPGVMVFSTFHENNYAILSGTSMSAPFISGLYALMAAQTLAEYDINSSTTIERTKIQAAINVQNVSTADVFPDVGNINGRAQIDETLRQRE